MSGIADVFDVVADSLREVQDRKNAGGVVTGADMELADKLLNSVDVTLKEFAAGIGGIGELMVEGGETPSAALSNLGRLLSGVSEVLQGALVIKDRAYAVVAPRSRPKQEPPT